MNIVIMRSLYIRNMDSLYFYFLNIFLIKDTLAFVVSRKYVAFTFQLFVLNVKTVLCHLAYRLGLDIDA